MAARPLGRVREPGTLPSKAPNFDYFLRIGGLRTRRWSRLSFCPWAREMSWRRYERDPDSRCRRRSAAYAALAAGDIHQLEQCFARDAVWHEPGSNIYSGDRVGWPEIRDEFLALLGPLSHGTLRTELVDIADSEEYVVAVHRATGKHNGLTLDSTSYEVVLVVRGRVQEVWAFHTKQAEVDAFWT